MNRPLNLHTTLTAHSFPGRSFPGSTPFFCSFSKTRPSKSFPCHSYRIFHSPYPVSPLFATLTKTAGVCINNSHCGNHPIRTIRHFPRLVFPKRQRTLIYSQSLAQSFALIGEGGGEFLPPGWRPHEVPTRETNCFAAFPTYGIIPPHRAVSAADSTSGEDSVSERAWSSTAPPGEFRPYVGAEESLKEFTIRAIILGALFGLLFGAVTVYVGLRAGLTVSASIPISVLSISILRAFGRSTILENNIVQTTGSAGESLAAGVMFTIPALIFLGFGAEFTFWRIFPLALLGGWLGVLLMVPLRRQLIVGEHGNLAFPEGTACADVLVAGERGGSFAGRVFWGIGLGGVYTLVMNTFQGWTSQPEAQPSWFPGASFRANITSEYLGVGYIIGPRVSGILFAGGIVSWLVIMPAIKFFGQLSGNTPIYPATIPIPQMTPDDLWRSYIRPMGAGAVAAAGLITLLRTLPTILSALTAGLKDVRAQRAGTAAQADRLEYDLPMKFVLIGSIVIIAMMWALLTFKPIPGA